MIFDQVEESARGLGMRVHLIGPAPIKLHIDYCLKQGILISSVGDNPGGGGTPIEKVCG